MTLQPEQIEQLLVQAKDSERKRSHLLLHENHQALLHRVVIALRQGTYVKPHNHHVSEKDELVFVLRGQICLVYFDAQGQVLSKETKSAGDVSAYAEHAPGAWHTLFPLSQDAVILEVKRGPFVPTSPEEFASWAPDEGSTEASKFLSWLEDCKVGEHYLADDA